MANCFNVSSSLSRFVSRTAHRSPLTAHCALSSILLFSRLTKEERMSRSKMPDANLQRRGEGEARADADGNSDGLPDGCRRNERREGREIEAAGCRCVSWAAPIQVRLYSMQARVRRSCRCSGRRCGWDWDEMLRAAGWAHPACMYVHVCACVVHDAAWPAWPA